MAREGLSFYRTRVYERDVSSQVEPRGKREYNDHFEHNHISTAMAPSQYGATAYVLFTVISVITLKELNTEVQKPYMVTSSIPS